MAPAAREREHGSKARRRNFVDATTFYAAAEDVVGSRLFVIEVRVEYAILNL
jgi:hypothetical protein